MSEKGMPELPELPEELRDLGRRMSVPEVDEESMAERVLARLIAESVPVPVREAETGTGPPGRFARARGWARRRWRMLIAALSGLLVVLVLTPPVRAAVVDWFDFDFGGVEVRYSPAPTPSASPAPAPAPSSAPVTPWCGPGVSAVEAARLAGFRPLIPAELGAPDVVSVAAAPAGRSVVSLCWRGADGRTVRLDEFPAQLDLGFSKQTSQMPEWLPLADGTNGLWFAQPHVLRFRLQDAQGGGWTPAARATGPTLLWVRGTTMTLRLEGVGSWTRAVAIANSAR
ncbi:hypothetical protein [Streptomyces sp. NPDC050738]|uniref:hypothetical protein n=1 Tax=Streptomyces sp. NPDC050738 TaxID=3154744 RepID=UPI003422342E